MQRSILSILRRNASFRALKCVPDSYDGSSVSVFVIPGNKEEEKLKEISRQPDIYWRSGANFRVYINFLLGDLSSSKPQFLRFTHNLSCPTSLNDYSHLVETANEANTKDGESTPSNELDVLQRTPYYDCGVYTSGRGSFAFRLITYVGNYSDTVAPDLVSEPIPPKVMITFQSKEGVFSCPNPTVTDGSLVSVFVILGNKESYVQCLLNIPKISSTFKITCVPMFSVTGEVSDTCICCIVEFNKVSAIASSMLHEDLENGPRFDEFDNLSNNSRSILNNSGVEKMFWWSRFCSQICCLYSDIVHYFRNYSSRWGPNIRELQFKEDSMNEKNEEKRKEKEYEEDPKCKYCIDGECAVLVEEDQLPIKRKPVGQRIFCRYCNRPEFEKPFDLWQHQQVKHKFLFCRKKVHFTCPFCLQTFPEVSSFKEHLPTCPRI